MGNCSTNIQHPGLCFHRNEGLLHPPGEEEHAAEVLVEGKGSVERVVEEGGSHDDQIIPGEEMDSCPLLYPPHLNNPGNSLKTIMTIFVLT